MVFAVDIVGDRAAERHETRARRRRQEPAGANQDAKALRQRHAGFRPHDACLLVECDQPIEAGHVDDAAAGVEIAVAVGAAQADGKARRLARQFSGDLSEFIREARPRHCVRFAHDAAPGREGLRWMEPRGHDRFLASQD
jgi:hypothetical protein